LICWLILTTALRSARGIREGGASREYLSAAAHFDGNIDNGARFGYHLPLGALQAFSWSGREPIFSD